jgi:hypothetical protein
MTHEAITVDERAGMDWWNALTEDSRAYWLPAANSAVPAEAWAEYKRTIAAAPAE